MNRLLHRKSQSGFGVKAESFARTSGPLQSIENSDIDPELIGRWLNEKRQRHLRLENLPEEEVSGISIHPQVTIELRAVLGDP